MIGLLLADATVVRIVTQLFQNPILTTLNKPGLKPVLSVHQKRTSTFLQRPRQGLKAASGMGVFSTTFLTIILSMGCPFDFVTVLNGSFRPFTKR